MFQSAALHNWLTALQSFITRQHSATCSKGRRYLLRYKRLFYGAIYNRLRRCNCCHVIRQHSDLKARHPTLVQRHAVCSATYIAAHTIHGSPLLSICRADNWLTALQRFVARQQAATYSKGLRTSLRCKRLFYCAKCNRLGRCNCYHIMDTRSVMQRGIQHLCSAMQPSYAALHLPLLSLHASPSC